MISKKLSEALLEAIGTIIAEDGWYTIPGTIYGCPSLSQGGSYYEKANNLILSDEFREASGVREKADYPGVYFIQFNPELMDTDTAERLLSRLVDIRMHASSSVPCLDEDLAAKLEAEDVRNALMETIESIAFSGTVYIPEQCVSDKRFADLLIKANAGILDLYTINAVHQCLCTRRKSSSSSRIFSPRTEDYISEIVSGGPTLKTTSLRSLALL